MRGRRALPPSSIASKHEPAQQTATEPPRQPTDANPPTFASRFEPAWRTAAESCLPVVPSTRFGDYVAGRSPLRAGRHIGGPALAALDLLRQQHEPARQTAPKPRRLNRLVCR